MLGWANAFGWDAIGSTVAPGGYFCGKLGSEIVSHVLDMVQLLFSPSQSAALTTIPNKAPESWATMKPGTFCGAIPAKLSERLRATVIAGLAKLVDDVNQ